MKDGFIKVAAATPKIKVADPAYNTEEILKIIDETEKNGASILVFSELTISGYTCGDLFLQQPLLTECKNQLLRIVKATENKSMLVVVGCPIVIKQKLYNCAVVISDGSILGIVPKTHLPNYSEFYELRHFTSGEGLEEDLWFGEEFGYVNVAVNQLFKCKEIPELVVACEICEDLWVPLPPSTYHAMAGATVICNPSASVETTTKESYVYGYEESNCGNRLRKEDINMKKSMRFSNTFGKFMFYFGNIIIGIIFVSPLIWMISASLKPEAKIFANTSDVMLRKS